MDSLASILNNDKTAISCHSGTVFPTTNLQIGMLCYRSDQLKLYQLIGINPDNWRFIVDLSSGIDAQFAAKLNAAAYTAADVLAKLLTVDGALSGLDADLLDGQHANAFAAAGHNHDTAYLGKTAKAADSDLLDGFNSTAFLRSVNGIGPDASGNVAVNVDLSSRVAKSGDPMTGNLIMQGGRLQVKADAAGTSAWIEMFDDESPNGKKYVHANANLIGFVGGDGSWKQYVSEAGQVWTANYGWLHDYFFSTVSNCAPVRYSGGNCNGNAGNCIPETPINCYGAGNISQTRVELIDNGSNVQLRSVQYSYNCNCNCDCSC
ncbi:MAG: hypothetical protein MO847_11975 [Candidatus Protistobacter heckmanni]|nr:hypothetical protein [Candidatus Protistobacter heckmanni]